MLWKMDREVILERFAGRNMPCVAYDERMNLYARLATEVQGLQMERDVDFVRLSYAPLAQYIQAEANAWMFAYGRLLNETSRKRLADLNAKLDKLEEDLERPPDTMADLKFVLSVIDQIWERNSEIEDQYNDISERYRTLVMYKHPLSADELHAVSMLNGRWHGIMQKVSVFLSSPFDPFFCKFLFQVLTSPPFFHGQRRARSTTAWSL
jgi:dynein heavy chain